jgi:hypothetical protein
MQRPPDHEHGRKLSYVIINDGGRRAAKFRMATELQWKPSLEEKSDAHCGCVASFYRIVTNPAEHDFSSITTRG